MGNVFDFCGFWNALIILDDAVELSCWGVSVLDSTTSVRIERTSYHLLFPYKQQAVSFR